MDREKNITTNSDKPNNKNNNQQFYNKEKEKITKNLEPKDNIKKANYRKLKNSEFGLNIILDTDFKSK